MLFCPPADPECRDAVHLDGRDLGRPEAAGGGGQAVQGRGPAGGPGPAVRRPAGEQPGPGREAAVRGLDHRPGPPACGRGEKKVAEAEEALGRSRGGYTTKVHLAATDEDTAVEVLLTPGQAGDAPQFDALFDAATARVPDAEEVVADKGYDSWAIKDKVIEASMAAHIPSRKTAVEPWPIDEAAYRERNRVERLINKMKQFRAAATRYDKRAASFLATIKVVLTFIKVRSFVNSP